MFLPSHTHFLYPSRVFAPKCASCARPILPAQVGTLHLEAEGARSCLLYLRSWAILGVLKGGHALRSAGLKNIEDVHAEGWGRCTLDALQGRGGPDSCDPLRHSAPLLVTGRAAHPAGSVLQWMLGSLGLEEQIGRPWPV